MVASVPFFSIITPIWGRVEYLQQIYDRLCSQGLIDIEWLIAVDDADPETLSAIAEIMKSSIFPIRTFAASCRIGKAVLDNLLIQNATGEYLIQNDSDDYLVHGALSHVKSYILERKLSGADDVALLADCVSTSGVSLLKFNDSLVKDKIITLDTLNLKGDGVWVMPRAIYTHARFAEVDFIIHESSTWGPLLLRARVLWTAISVRVNRRGEINSVSFSGGIKYARGSAYAISLEHNDIKRFARLTFFARFRILVLFYRYACLAGLSKNIQWQIWPLQRRLRMRSVAKLLGYGLAMLDYIRGNVSNTHKKFDQNYARVEIKELII
jgi:glycosyltransferase involved in cell wall biosynthesis